jgi:MFS family permease
VRAGSQAADRPFARIFVADAIVRTAYQMGKTPVLPIFAASLGASDILLGLVVSISTLTGILVKPLVGFLSDRQGRRAWLLIAAVLFISMPFTYLFVRQPAELFALRLVHGLATAIFGPVSLALVAEMAGYGRATRMGVFGLARSIGYLLAPVSAAFLLTQMTPQLLFTLTGGIAALSLIPLLALDRAKRHQPLQKITIPLKMRLQALGHAFVTALSASAQRQALWVAGGLEMIVNMATYAVKAFLPLNILVTEQSDHALVLSGLFFSVQEAVHMLTRTPGGMAADYFGRLMVISAGVLVMAAGLLALPYLQGDLVICSAVVLGAAQGLIFPAIVAFIADQSDYDMGTGMGLYGATRNLGKVLGPVIAGFILTFGNFDDMLVSTGILLLAVAGAVALVGTLRRFCEP